MSAIISECGNYRYRLDRKISDLGPVYAFFGINPSTADASVDDATVRKWIGFTKKWGASKFIVGNVFAYRSTDVKKLRYVSDPIGSDYAKYIDQIIADADVLVPCWGNKSKAPKELRDRFEKLLITLRQSGKPVVSFGVTESGDPMHPLMLPYSTQLIDFN